MTAHRISWIALFASLPFIIWLFVLLYQLSQSNEWLITKSTQALYSLSMVLIFLSIHLFTKAHKPILLHWILSAAAFGFSSYLFLFPEVTPDLWIFWGISHVLLFFHSVFNRSSLQLFDGALIWFFTVYCLLVPLFGLYASFLTVVVSTLVLLLIHRTVKMYRRPSHSRYVP